MGPIAIAQIQTWNGWVGNVIATSVLLNGFCKMGFCLVLSSRTENFSRKDSNSDHQSRKLGHIPLDHHHSASQCFPSNTFLKPKLINF